MHSFKYRNGLREAICKYICRMLSMTKHIYETIASKCLKRQCKMGKIWNGCTEVGWELVLH